MVTSLSGGSRTRCGGDEMLVHIRKDDGGWYTLKLIRGPKGEKGDPGDPGTGLELLDAYDTVEELRAAHPAGSAGDCYAVGTMAYVWSETAGDWKALGEITGKDGAPGQDGLPGADGKDGVGIASVVQTTVSTEDGGENVVAVTLTDGKTAEITIRNGSKGSPGAPGATPTSFPASGITGTLPVENGGTGVTNLSELATALGVGSNAGFVTGTYLGDQSMSSDTWQEVALGFQPSFVIVWAHKDLILWQYDMTSSTDKYKVNAGFALAGYPALLPEAGGATYLETTTNGFKVRNVQYMSDGYDARAYLNQTNRTYCYIAGR